MSSKEQQLITVTDLKGRYLYVNDHYCQQTGYGRDQLINRSSHDLTHKDMPKEVLHELSATLKKGFSWQGVLRIQSKNNQDIWLDAFITPQYDHGNIIGFQSISTIAQPKLANNAKAIYSGINKGNKWATFEITKNHKFAFLVLLSLVAQFFIFTQLGLLNSAIAAMSAMAPIFVFWHDIIPTAKIAVNMQKVYDSISRKVYFGKGTASVIDANFAMLKTKLKAILSRTMDAAKPIKNVMSTVADEVNVTRANLETQKNEIEQLSVSMNQMQASTNEIAANTVSAAQDLDNTFAQCEEAQQGINHTTDKIKQLAKEVEQASASADTLTESANSVGELMADIQSIADQTNLLALNAAIEAARAGEHGRGFAVVADEVRSLSSRTQESAEKIHHRLSAMSSTIEQWVEVMNTNKLAAEHCAEIAESSNERIEQVVNKVQSVTSIATEIATAAEQQNVVSEEINQNISEIHLSTEQTWQQTDKVAEQMQALEQSVEDIANVASTFIPQKK